MLVLWVTMSQIDFVTEKLKLLHSDSLTWHPTNPISIPFFTPVRRLCRDSHTHTWHALPSTIPLYYRCLCAVTPPWTAYVPPRGAAAACLGSSSAVGCSHCCSAEGHARQTTTTEGITAIKLQIKPAQKYQEYIKNECDRTGHEWSHWTCQRTDKLQQMSHADISSHYGATFVWNKCYLIIDLRFVVDGCYSHFMDKSFKIYSKPLTSQDIKPYITLSYNQVCREAVWSEMIPQSAAPWLSGFQFSLGQTRETDLRQTPGGT